MKALELTPKDILGHNIFDIVGDDEYWIQFTIDFFKAQLTEANEFSFKVLDKPTLLAVRDALSSISMFGGDEIIVIKNLEVKPKTNEAIAYAKLLESLDKDIILLFVKCMLTPEIRKQVIEISAEKQDVAVLRRYISKLFQFGIDNLALDTLIGYTNRDMLAINNEVTKLQAYAQDKKVTSEMVKDLVVNQLENQIYELANAFGNKQRKKALEILDNFYKRGIEYTILLGSLTNQYRRMFYCRVSKESDKNLSIFLNVKEYAITKAKEAASFFSPSELKKCLTLLENAEVDFKTGVCSPETAFKTSVSRLLC